MSGRSRVLDVVPGLRALASAQLGVVRRDQLAELGITRHHVRRQVEAGRWRTVGPHVVVLQSGSLDRAQAMRGSVLHAGSDAQLAGLTALENLGLRGWLRPALHVMVPRGVRVRPLPGVVPHQVSVMPVPVAGRSPATAPAARAALDAACWERSPRTASGLLVAVAQQRLATPAQMLDLLPALGRVPNVRAMRAALARAAEGAESLAEVDVERAVRELRLGRVRRQVQVETRSGPRRLDLVVDLPDGRTLVIEVDGVHHQEARARLDDAVRDAELVALGYVVLRIPAWADRAWLRRQLAVLAVPVAG